VLVIRRRAGESILIADGIEIEILETASRHVKLGIKAPKSVSVLRKEVRLTQDHNLAAAQAIPLDLLGEALARFQAKPANGRPAHNSLNPAPPPPISRL